MVKFTYSEKATQLWKNVPVFFEITNIVAFSEYLYFKVTPQGNWHAIVQ